MSDCPMCRQHLPPAASECDCGWPHKIRVIHWDSYARELSCGICGAKYTYSGNAVWRTTCVCEMDGRQDDP
jgi:hypothetical protein